MKMIKVISFSLLFIMGFSLAHAGQAEKSRDVYEFKVPVSLGEFVLNDVIDNESRHPGLGTTLLYNAPGVKISVFIYDNGLKSAILDTSSDLFKLHFKQVNTDVENYHAGAKRLEAKVDDISGLSVAQSAYFYHDKFDNAEEYVYSHAYLAREKGYFIKIRTTYSAENRPMLGFKMQELFVEAFFKYIQ